MARTAAANTPVAGVTASATAPVVTATTASPATTAATAAAATSSPDGGLVRVAYVATRNLEILDAVIGAAKTFGWELREADQATSRKGAEAVMELAQSGAQIVIANGSDLEAGTRAAAIAFPKVYFIGVGQAGAGDPLPNLLTLGAGPTRQDQLGFMDGVVAGYATQAKVLTAVGYTTDATGLKYRNGFLHGVRLSCSRCRVDFVDVTDLNDGAAAAEKARLNASLSSDVVFAAAGAASAAALQAAAGKGAWVLGADSDIYQSVFGGGSAAGADKVLASAYFDPGAAITAALKAYKAGKPWTGPQPYSAATGALVLAPYHVSTDVLSDLDRSDALAVLGQLADGSLDTGIDLTTGNEQ